MPSNAALTTPNVPMLGIRSKLLLGFGGLVAVMLAIILCAVNTFNNYSRQTERTIRDDLVSVVAARDMRDALDEGADAAYESIRAEGPVDTKRIESASAEFTRAMTLQQARVTLPGEEPLTAAVQREWDQSRQLLTALPEVPFTDRGPFVREEIRPHLRAARFALHELAKLNTTSIESSHRVIQGSTESTRRTIFGLGMAGVCFAAVFATVVSARIVKPIATMTVLAEYIAHGDLDQKVTVRSRDELGRLEGAFNTMTTELRRLRALDADRLSRAYQAAQTAIDSLPDGVIMLDGTGRVELANRSATRLFFVKAGEDIALRPEVWLRESIGRAPGAFDSFAPSIKVDDNGFPRHFLPRPVPLRNGDGRMVGTTLILVDVTDFRRLDQLKDSLLSMASHELKTPLTSMRMILPLVLEQKVGPLTEKQAELLAVSSDAVERMRRIVDTILDLGRLASGKMPLEARPLLPANVVRRAVAAHRAAFEAKGVNLKDESPGGLPPVWADAAQVDHVFANLLNNALRFTPAGGKVSIAADRTDGSVAFRISDTGCGVAEAHVTHLFESFYRVPGQGSDTGSGLGLALVRQIVESHRGRVGVESALGKGSTFWFTLPVANTETSHEQC